MGDDLYLDISAHHGGYASDFLLAFVHPFADKYRPVLTPVLFILTHLFSGEYAFYRDVNLALLVVNVALVGYLAWLLSRRWAVSLGAMVVAVLSRFDWYYVLQVYGVMEGLALLFALLTVIAVQRAYKQQSFRALAWANVAFVLAEFTHERYIVLCAFLITAGLLIPLRGGRWVRILAVILPAALALLNYSIKVFILRINFFTGGGGRSASLSLPEIAGFMRDGLITVMGNNVGPPYLSALPAASQGPLGSMLAALVWLPVVALGLLVLARDIPAIRSEPRRLRKYALGLALFVPLLFSASTTFRQEYRWLYAPYLVTILGCCWALGHITRARILVPVAAVILFSGIGTVDLFYSQYVDNIYFFAAQERADAVHRQVIDGHRGDLSSATVFFVTPDSTFQWFDTADGGIFMVYAPGTVVDARFVADALQVCQAVSPKKLRLVYQVGQSSLKDITATTVARCRSLRQ